MALRQKIPDVALGLGLFSGDGKIVKKVKPPVKVPFRAGSDLKEVVAAVRDSKVIAVEAAYGAGKSTRMPGMLAKAMGLLVVQVVPNPYLAVDLADYVAGLGIQCVAVVDAVTEWPVDGVVIVSAAALVAHWIGDGRLVMPPCLIVHDECHESDAFTHFVRLAWPVVEGVGYYVSATATSGPADFRKPELPVQVTHRTYDFGGPSSEWDPYADDGNPWEINSIDRNVLIFEDSKANAERLHSAYESAGLTPFRLHSRMKMAQFKAAMVAARSGRDVVVLIADSTFRSGFTMPVATVIDTGVVCSTTVESGNLVRYTRDAYGFERYQAAGRVGRDASMGSVATVWAPSTRAENRLVRLEDNDAEAAALLFRTFGKAVSVDLLDTQMSDGKVPRDLVGSLQSSTPLALLHDNQLATVDEMATPEGRRSPMVKSSVKLANADTLDYKNHMVSADVARNYEEAPGGGWVPKHRKIDSGYSDGTVDEARESKVSGPSSAVVSMADVVRDLINASVSDSEGPIIEGEYYCAPSMPAATPTYSAMFPDGYASVVRMFSRDEGRSLQYGLSVNSRWVAIQAALHRYNLVACELNGAMLAAQDVGALAKVRDSVAVREWVSGFVSRVGELQAELHVLADLVVRLADRFCMLEPLPPECMKEYEENFSQKMVTGLRAIPARATSVTNAYESVKSLMASEIGIMTDGLARAQIGGHRRDRERAVLDVVQMPAVGRGMRAVRPVIATRTRSESRMLRFGRWVAMT